MIQLMAPPTEATVWTVMFSQMVEVRNARRIAMEITAAGMAEAKVRPTSRPSTQCRLSTGRRCGWSVICAAIAQTASRTASDTRPGTSAMARRGAVTDARSTAIDCDNVLMRSDNEDMEIVGIGLKDVMVVATSDAVLVADMNRAQDVKLAVAALKARDKRQAEAFRRDHRPWGWFETLVLADRFQVKRIVVHPGASLSLQSHVHRSEHWIVVSGTARVTVDDHVTLVTENQSIYVPLGAVHRMENPGKVPMVLIEVQTGVYLGEDDIIRYDDVYARS